MRLLNLLWVAGPLAAVLTLHGCGSDSTDNSAETGGSSGSGGSAGKGGSGGAEAGTDAGETGGGGSGGQDAGWPLGGSGGNAGWPIGGSGGEPDAGADVDFQYDAPVHDANFADACVDETAEAKPVPLDIYFLLDASTSMSSPAGSGAAGDCNASPPFTPANSSKWCKAVNAIAGYVSSAQAAGNRAAIQYFKHYTSHNCNGAGYDTPAVGLGELPGNFSGHAQTLVEANGGLNWAYPWSNTPTEGALRGLAAFTGANVAPGRVIIGILVTDGMPYTCSESDSTLAGIAQQHFSSTGVHTFMVGMNGAEFGRLETWANYPGAISHDDTNDSCGNCSNCTCHHYNVGDGNPAVFIAALNQIQQNVLSCTFLVPTPSQGVLDPDLVKVEYFPGGNPPAIELPRVGSAAACAGDGWYYEYDGAGQPTTINLCPASCATVQADNYAEVKIRIACQGS